MYKKQCCGHRSCEYYYTPHILKNYYIVVNNL